MRILKDVLGAAAGYKLKWCMPNISKGLKQQFGVSCCPFLHAVLMQDPKDHSLHANTLKYFADDNLRLMRISVLHWKR